GKMRMEPLQGRRPIPGQCVDPALDPDEPAKHVSQENLWGIGDASLEVARSTWRARQRHRAVQRPLAIGGHDRLAATATGRRIAAPPAVFFDDPGAPFGTAARPPGYRLDQNLDPARSGDGEQTEAEEATELAHAGVVLAPPPPTRGAHGQPDLVAGR